MQQPQPFYDAIRTAPHGAAHFWARVKRGGPDECWPWTSQRGKVAKDYGRVQIGDRAVNSNRVAWALANGTDPADQLIRHTCDNPPCCNPAHLIAGTHADNAQDKVARKRWKGGDQRGERNPRALLTAKRVANIVEALKRGKDSKLIAKRYPVTHHAIDRIAAGKAWVHEAAAAGWEPAVAVLTARLPQQFEGQEG